jgi:hypothetical protein
METGKIGLNSYMYGIRPDKAPTDRCLGCPTQRETIYYVLINCPSYRIERRKYWTEGTPHSLGEIFTDTQKTATAAKLILSLTLLDQVGRVNKTLLAATERMHDQNQDKAVQAHGARTHRTDWKRRIKVMKSKTQ